MSHILPRDAPAAHELPNVGPCDEECDISWLAGLLEGEGTFGMTRRGARAYPVVSVEMTDEDIVLRAARILRAGPVRKRDPKYETWRATHIVTLTGHRAAEWMRRLCGRMGKRRTLTIETALGAYHPIRLAEVPRVCAIAGCGRPHRSRGLCHAHYMSWSRDHARGRVPRVTPLR
jgi:hypothetical protein